MNSKTIILNNLKNIIGWRTNRKLIVFSIDDYGNVRLDSKKASENLNLKNLNGITHFDLLDTLETREDLEMLFEVLYSVRDSNNKPAVITPFALPSNINFEGIIENNFSSFETELLPETFIKKEAIDPKAYLGAWDLWKQGISSGIFVPQFHGREHLNLKVFFEKLDQKDDFFVKAIKNRTYTGFALTGYPTISSTAAFDFWDIQENKPFENVIKDGVKKFISVFGYQPIHFNAPGASASSAIESYIFDEGISFIDNPLIKHEHLGNGKYKKVYNYTGKKLKSGLININRNVVFEPNGVKKNDWLSYTMAQIEAAFFWKKPAIISSHRVNFGGYIDPENRKKGLEELSKLLKAIVKRWPDVEFVSSFDLIQILKNKL
jgi:hypothetical protein